MATKDLVVTPVPNNAGKPNFFTGTYGHPVDVYEYRDGQGRLVMYIGRYERPEESKLFLPFTFWQTEHGHKWRRKNLPGKKILFNLPDLTNRQKAAVLFVEGEKAAKAGIRLFPDYVVVTSPGGVNAIAKIDWSPLFNRRVYIIPDNDRAGMDFSDAVRAIIKTQGASTAIVPIPEEFPEKWDIADSFPPGYGLDRFKEMLESQKLYSQKPRHASRSIYINYDQFGEELADIWKAIHATNNPPWIFRRMGRLVQLVTREDGINIESFDTPQLLDKLARRFDWYKITRRGPEVGVPSDRLLKVLMSSPCEELPELRLVLRCPAVGRDGALHYGPGYDEALKVFFHTPAGIKDSVPENPLRHDLDKAKRVLLDDLLGDFPFKQPVDKVNIVSLLVAAVVRPAITGPLPFYALTASCPGSGKSLLARLVHIVVTGKDLALGSLPENDEEIRKRVTSILDCGTSFFAFDNIPTDKTVDSASLASLATTRYWTDRILGKTKSVGMPNDCLWVFTGNNLSLSNELSRRVIYSALEPKQAKPWERQAEEFEHPDIVRWTISNRDELLRSLLVLCSNWLANGRPVSKRTLGSFEEMTGILGGVLEAAGIAGFNGNRQAIADEADSESQEWIDFADCWFARYQCGHVRPNELANLARIHNSLSDIRGFGVNESQATRLGLALKRVKGRIFGRYRIVLAKDSANKGRFYRLEVVENIDGKSELDKWGDLLHGGLPNEATELQ